MADRAEATNRDPSLFEGPDLVSVAPPVGGELTTDLAGDKAATLSRLAAGGAGVPPFFVLNTRAWTEWRQHGLSERLRHSVTRGIQILETTTGSRFGQPGEALLLAVRISAMAGVPTLLTATLNVGATTAPTAWDELITAISSAFESWTSDRAKRYRRLNRIADDRGPAVMVQAMVPLFHDESCATGHAHTRNPADGSNVAVGAWTTGPDQPQRGLGHLVAWNPAAAAGLADAFRIVERVERHPQTVEFVIDGPHVHLLQSVPLDVNPTAAARVYLDMAGAGILDRAETLARLRSLPLDDLDRHELVAPEPCLAVGTGASPGVGSGICLRDPIDAAAQAEAGTDVVFLRPETSPRDVFAMKSAKGIITERGGDISHAAIFSREYGIPCAVGCGDLGSVPDGTELTVNGATGEVYLGRHTPVRTTPPAVAEARAFLAAHSDGGQA